MLMIGGTGTISSAITRQLAASGHDLWLLNRGNRSNEVPANVRQVIADINDEEKVRQSLGLLPDTKSTVYTNKKARRISAAGRESRIIFYLF